MSRPVSPAPAPPTKHTENDGENELSFPPLPSFSSFDQGLLLPATPITPTTPINNSPPQNSKPKKLSPLSDLIDTEKIYVDQLTGIIRKVAAAWSRSNLPPPDLDTMFRSIESVYRANRSLLGKLKEIGTNPSSPKALGDLLMRWIDDLEPPYTVYCSKYCYGFDTWEPAQSNPKLTQVLSAFSESNPLPDSASSSLDNPKWTLDSLFLLPKLRLKYYRKLYARLLKSTAPGRSDHKLLVGALDTLDRLLSTQEQREEVHVGQSSSDQALIETQDEVVIDMRSSRDSDAQPSDVPVSNIEPSHSSASSSVRGSSASSREPSSHDTASTSIRGSSTTMTSPISDLERRLSTQRTLDIFTMNPKGVRLQMSPPTLTFTRELRFSLDVVIHFTPRSTGQEIIHRRGHLFLLSDLFLVCERMSPEERTQHGQDGQDMWLCYPPLAGKVLRVSEVLGQDTVLQVAIMRKETLILHAESLQARNLMLAEFKECIEFASSIGPVSNQSPPPVPPLNVNGLSNGPPKLPTSFVPNPISTQRPSIGAPQRSSDSISHSVSPPQSRRPSPPVSLREGDVPRFAPPHSRGSMQEQGFSGQPPSLAPGQTFRHPSMISQMSTSSDPHLRHGPNGPPNGPPNGLPPQGLPHPSLPQGLPSHPSPFGQPNPSFPRPGSEPTHSNGPNVVRKSPSSRSIHSQYESPNPPPLPTGPGGYNFPNNVIPRNNSSGNLHVPQPHPLLPSQFNARISTMEPTDFTAPSPPQSPVEESRPYTGPTTSTISAQMKCKVFLKQQHAQWKSLGSAKLKLYRQDPTNIKQLVVEADNRDHSVLISTIVLTDGVERVGKTGVAIELSDKGARTGIVYMIQLRNETSAGGLFDSLLAGSDRSVRSQ